MEEIKDLEAEEKENKAEEKKSTRKAEEIAIEISKLPDEEKRALMQVIAEEIQAETIKTAQIERANLINKLSEDTVKTFVLDFFGLNDYSVLLETKKLFLLEEIASNLEALKQMMREKKI